MQRLMIILHFFVGIGGMVGGTAALSTPHAPMGIDAAEMLKHSPFNDFLIPGLLLFGVIGLGNVLCGILMLRTVKFQYQASGIAGGALMVWIIVQCIMLRAVVALHVIFFLIGALQAALSAHVLFQRNLFPFDIIRKIFRLK